MIAVLLCVGAYTLSAPAKANDAEKAPHSEEVLTEDPVPLGFTSWAALMAAQAPLEEAAQELSTFIEEIGAYDGYADIEIEVSTGTVILWWKLGVDVPAELLSLIEQIEAQPNVSVNVSDARYSRVEIENEAMRLMDLASERPALRIVSAQPLPGFAGLLVTVDGDTEEVSGDPVVDADGAVIKTIVSGSGPMYFSRTNDSPPWWGGARVKIGNAFGCSTGFSVKKQFLWSVKRYMLTAGHCALHQNGNPFTDGGNDFMGLSTGASTSNKTRDTILVEVTSNAGRMYDGGVGSGEFSKPVKGASGSFTGLWLCTSGAFSGARCSIVVKNTALFWYSFPTGYKHGPHVLAEHTGQKNAAGEGDSGGPVFSLDANSNVIAKGTISAGTPTKAAQCTGVINTNGQNRICSYDVIYPDISATLKYHDVSIVTH